MVYRAGLYTASALLFASGAFAQISFPGQYPGQYPGQGRYPNGGSSSPIPGQGRRTSTRQQQDNTVPTTTVSGVLRRVASDEMVVESDDKRIVTLALASTTKYYKATGGGGKVTDLQPGDKVSIDATKDDNGYYHAKNVNQVKQGTAEERAAAMQPVDSSPVGDGGGNDPDDDRPRLKRASSSGTSDAATSPDPTPAAAPVARADSTAPRPAPREEAAAPAPPDPADPGPPRLRRGSARAEATADAPPVIAENTPPAVRPSIHAEEVNGVTRAPQPPKMDQTKGDPSATPARAPNAIAKSGDSVIDNARQAAFSFSETLPNFMVKQFTTRYQTEAARGGQTSWRAIDNVSADVVSDGGKETYKNVLVNGKAPKEAIEKTGSWSTGEFSSQLLDILDPATDADFHNRRTTTIVNRSAFRYDLSVDQANSHWHVYAAAESFKPEYTGSIWIDKETSRVLRIELSARSMPRGFPLDTVESAVDYDFVQIGDGKFLLPVHSESLSCERGTAICSRNVIDFRNYRKFGADTSITFDATPDK